ncbi:hypothetical protein RYX36_010419 [Vicia faba]
MDSLILLLLLVLLGYRFSSHENHSFPWFVAFLCESWFTITWITTMSTKWTPARTKTFLHRLAHRVSESELPALDLFVTTADPVLEPPIITVNTVLSLLALDYPSNKLACYVSDDACSPLTFYALQEAAKFAEIWVPFCKKYNVQCRAPFRYFCDEAVDNKDFPEFKQDWLKMKEEYEQLCGKIKNAAEKSIPCQLMGEFAVFSQTQVKNHQTIIKVIQRNKGLPDTMPRVIYISREKSSNHSHHHKAGAMNVLTRISGLMTNAPFILNLDCDMYVNNPKIVLHALCILLDSKGEKEVAFAQCPQRFYDAVKDDAYGNQLVALPMYIGGGFAGLQGIIYAGTNCFHRRKVIYGLSPNLDIQNANKDHGFTKGTLLSEKETVQIFGTSKGFVDSATYILKGTTFDIYKYLELEEATKVASCDYEYNTAWGTTILFVQLRALMRSFWAWKLIESGEGFGVGEVFCSAYVVLCYLPFLKGLFGKGKYGIPFSIIWKSMVLAFLFVELCSGIVAN